LACTYGSTPAARREKTSKVVTIGGARTRETAEIWEGTERDPKKQMQWKIAGEWGYPICGSLDGDRLILGGSGKIAAYRFSSDLSKLEEAWAPLPIPVLSPRAVAIHPSENRVWTGRAMFEFSTGRVLAEVKNRDGMTDCFSPVWVGAQRVAEIIFGSLPMADSSEGAGELLQIALWDAESGTLLARSRAPQAQWLCSSPDGLHIAEAGGDKRVRIRNGRTLEVEREFRAHEDSVRAIAWHPSLPLLATAAKDGLIRIWDLNHFRKLEELNTDQSTEVLRLSIPPNGLELVETQNKKIRVYLPESFRSEK
jgi:WD40 repeat protein